MFLENKNQLFNCIIYFIYSILAIVTINMD